MNGTELDTFHSEEKAIDRGLEDAYHLSEPVENNPCYLAGWHIGQQWMYRDHQRLRNAWLSVYRINKVYHP